MSSLSSSYLLPAVLLNPVVILHGLNTFCSHFISSTTSITTSNHQWLENLGPAVAPGPYFDVHNSQRLCLGYTALMVLVQILAYGKVNDTRIRRKNAQAAAKAEREQLEAQRSHKAASDIPMSATTKDHITECDFVKNLSSINTGTTKNGRLVNQEHDCAIRDRKENLPITIIEDRTTEPSGDKKTIA